MPSRPPPAMAKSAVRSGILAAGLLFAAMVLSSQDGSEIPVRQAAAPAAAEGLTEHLPVRHFRGVVA
jgi:hypothetical protein